jgi:hypothetical protein
MPNKKIERDFVKALRHALHEADHLDRYVAGLEGVRHIF